MKALILFLPLFLFVSCNRISHGEYRNYKVTNDQATPVSQYGGAPYRQRR